MQFFLNSTNIPLEPVMDSPFSKQQLVCKSMERREIGTQTLERDTQKYIICIKKLQGKVKLLEEIIESKTRQVENLTRIIKSD